MKNLILNPDSLQVLVNKDNYLFKDFIPCDLELIDSKYSCKDIFLRHDARIAFEKLCSDALKDGFKIKAESGYRDYNYQNDLFSNYVSLYGYDYASLVSAEAGHSEHQTGLAVDVCGSNLDYNFFDKSKEFNWMIDNAYKYGFILRYPKGYESITGYKYEPWHFRYVGKCAEEIKNKKLVLETYLKN